MIFCECLNENEKNFYFSDEIDFCRVNWDHPLKNAFIVKQINRLLLLPSVGSVGFFRVNRG